MQLHPHRVDTTVDLDDVVFGDLQDVVHIRSLLLVEVDLVALQVPEVYHLETIGTEHLYIEILWLVASVTTVKVKYWRNIYNLTVVFII